MAERAVRLLVSYFVATRRIGAAFFLRRSELFATARGSAQPDDRNPDMVSGAAAVFPSMRRCGASAVRGSRDGFDAACAMPSSWLGVMETLPSATMRWRETLVITRALVRILSRGGSHDQFYRTNVIRGIQSRRVAPVVRG